MNRKKKKIEIQGKKKMDGNLMTELNVKKNKP